MDEINWYENCSLDNIKNIIKDNIDTATRSFLAIGYYLKNVRDRKLYQEDEYKDIWEFANTEFGISQSWASRYMSINDRFSKDGNSPMIQEEYKGFDKSKLSEMLTLTDEQLKQVTLTTTVAQIKDIKKSYATSHKTEPAQVELSAVGTPKKVYPEGSLLETPGCEGGHSCFSCGRYCGIRQEDSYCVDAPMGNPFSCTTMNVYENLEMDIGDKCMFINLSLAYVRAGDKEPVPCCKECSELCGYRCNRSAQGLISTLPQDEPEEAEEPENVNYNPINISEVTEKACANCNYNDMTSDEFKVIDPDGGLPCNNCDDKLSNWTPKIEDDTKVAEDDTESVETVHADVIQMGDIKLDCYNEEEGWHEEIIDSLPNPEGYGLSDVKVEIRTHTDNLTIMRKENMIYPARFKTKMRLDAAVALMDKMTEPVVEELEPDQPEQPELPVLKNNDQRKEWIDNYQSWPVWIDQTETGEKYYRYNLTDKVSMVVKVSRKHSYAGYKETKGYEYGAEQYYLIGVRSEWHTNKSSYVEDDTRTFFECNTNKSALVDYLKDFQKKGV